MRDALIFMLGLLGSGPADTTAREADVLRFEAEDVSHPTAAWAADVRSPNRWNLWSKDTDAEKKWSGGKVLHSPPVREARPAPEDGAPVLHVRLTAIPEGRWFRVRTYQASHPCRPCESCLWPNSILERWCKV